MKTLITKHSLQIFAVAAMLFGATFLPQDAQAHHRKGKKVVVVKKRPVYKPRRRVVVAASPARATFITHRGIRYKYINGVYYRPRGCEWVTVRAPYGIGVRALPRGYKTLTVRNKRYYRYGNTYYHWNNNRYVVVKSPYIA